MKNKIILLLLVAIITLSSGCFASNKNEGFEKIEPTYTESDLEEISLTINKLDLVLNMSNNSHLKQLLLSVNLYKNKTEEEQTERTSKYVLTFGKYEFTIYDNGTICYIDNDIEQDYLLTSDNAFSYLDTLIGSDLLNFNNYTELQIIKVFNSFEDSIEIKEKQEFLNNLKQIKYFKLENMEHYQLGNLKYQILVDEELINIYGEYIVINDNLYVVTEGNFSFLNDLKFSSSSGWLPWI